MGVRTAVQMAGKGGSGGRLRGEKYSRSAAPPRGYSAPDDGRKTGQTERISFGDACHDDQISFRCGLCHTLASDQKYVF